MRVAVVTAVAVVVFLLLLLLFLSLTESGRPATVPAHPSAPAIVFREQPSSVETKPGEKSIERGPETPGESQPPDTSAKTGVVFGIVRLSGEEEFKPVFGAVVEASFEDGMKTSEPTDEKGNYEISGLPAGCVTLRVEFEGRIIFPFHLTSEDYISISG